VSSDGPDRHQPPETSATGAPFGSTVDYLAGDWIVVRRISDHRSGKIGSFRGTASFSRGTPLTLAYAESGELRLGSHRGPAERSLLVVDAGDGTADVRFADGREFYRLDLRTGHCAAVHPCRADRYEMTAARLSPDRYTEAWRVTGPDKDYELQTTYTRAGLGGAR
jgi:Family of unknown function (DUF6314)